MGLQYFFHLFGVDLLAAGVNALAAPAQQTYGAIGIYFGEVARNGIANVVDGDESGCRLCLVFVITHWRATTKCHTTTLAAAGNNVATIFMHHTCVGAEFECCST